MTAILHIQDQAPLVREATQGEIRGNLEGRLIALYQDETQSGESAPIRAGRIAFTTAGIFISFTSLLPATLVAGSFNAFPGARELSSFAILNFACFGSWGYYKWGEALFQTSSEKQKGCLRAASIVRHIASGLTGIASRMPTAGQALFLAPGIPAHLRPFCAIYGLLGTAGPECLSMYETFLGAENGIRRFISHDILYKMQDNILKCILGAKERGLAWEPDLESQEPVLNQFFRHILTWENFHKAEEIEGVKRSRRVVRIPLGTGTTLGTTCSLVQSAFLTKFAIDYLSPQPSVWKWVISGAASSTVAWTSYKNSFQSAYLAFDTLAACWGSRHHVSLAENLYPKTYRTLCVGALIMASLLFGILYESAKASVNVDSWEGLLFFAGNYTASVLLIYFATRELFIEQGLQKYARSRFSKEDERKRAIYTDKLHTAEEWIGKATVQDLGSCLKRVRLNATQKEILNQGISTAEIEQQAILV